MFESLWEQPFRGEGDLRMIRRERACDGGPRTRRKESRERGKERSGDIEKERYQRRGNESEKERNEKNESMIRERQTENRGSIPMRNTSRAFPKYYLPLVGGHSPVFKVF
jgi:hypothetical protein